MGCLFALVALISARLALFLLWAFTNYVNLAFHGGWHRCRDRHQLVGAGRGEPQSRPVHGLAPLESRTAARSRLRAVPSASLPRRAERSGRRQLGDSASPA